ncbi:hypothetical protein BN6_07720 [Saccharothrix espanaensis DSM 44229]|uniref:Uncharacterized protein n=1 Tax=Saccharothrix espanaensis (strain ATCC 51144 / DSM 44229 / JCM 9112 / NBRC 15066 / NRRL 15764) TaxID=1179773 RepID=K0JQX2_SACES|nr:hypothetical protein BN6_07720 [Saccharothrix espanaensis DSM 44229]
MPYVWWHSGYDSLCHAFPSTQPSEAYFEAACTHSVPPEHLLREPNGPLCVPCLIKVGSELPKEDPTTAGNTWRD